MLAPHMHKLLSVYYPGTEVRHRALSRGTWVINCSCHTVPCYSGSMASNRLYDEGAKVIAEAIVKMPQLSHLECASP